MPGSTPPRCTGRERPDSWPVCHRDVAFQQTRLSNAGARRTVGTVPGCSCQENHLDPLGTEGELVFPWAGVLILPGDIEMYHELATDPSFQQYGGPLHGWHHGVVHFIQALGSPFLQDHGLR